MALQLPPEIIRQAEKNLERKLSAQKGVSGYTRGQCKRLLDWLTGECTTPVKVDTDITCQNARLVCSALKEAMIHQIDQPDVAIRIGQIELVAHKHRYEPEAILASKL